MALKVVYQRSTDGITRKIKDIPVGTVFSAKANKTYSCLLRMYDGVVDLISPGNTWTRTSVSFDDYREISATLTIHE